MRVRVADDGWIEIGPYPGEPTDQCHIGLGARSPDEWHPAFKRTRGRHRVLAVPVPGLRGSLTVWLRVNAGPETRVGTIRL